MTSPTIAIAATFTAEPLAPVLEYWMEERRHGATLAFAPFDQVIQTLLDPASPFFADVDGLNVVALRIEDLGSHGNDGLSLDAARASIDEIVVASVAALARSKRRFLVVSCPPSPDAPAALAEVETILAAACAKTPGLHFLGAEEITRRYPSSDYHDAYGAREGRIPYTEKGFAAIATMIVRRYEALRREKPFKVIVLDCDQTLWKGVVGEDGVDGIVVDEGRSALQRFMAEQKATYGMLLAMCSKNDEVDVLNVFSSRSDMILKREDFVGWRINWEPKSANLRALAKELELGLDSFVFVDDDPVQCAEVRAGCPDVLVLQVPVDPGEIDEVLRETWELDRVSVTDEDRRRTEMYAQNREREALRTKAVSLDEYLETLGLEITIARPSDEQLPRAAQLTQRTNQFNLGNIRRTEAELKQHPGESLVVGVRDRFGDYGLVGVVVFAPEGASLVVDTFLLSCRVLGRRVENTILERLRAEALERGLAEVAIVFRPTAKNSPAASFLEGAGAIRTYPVDGGTAYVFPVRASR